MSNLKHKIREISLPTSFTVNETIFPLATWIPIHLCSLDPYKRQGILPAAAVQRTETVLSTTFQEQKPALLVVFSLAIIDYLQAHLFLSCPSRGRSSSPHRHCFNFTAFFFPLFFTYLPSCKQIVGTRTTSARRREQFGNWNN